MSTDTPPFDFDASSTPVLQRLGTGLAKIGLTLKSRAWRDAGPERLTPTQGQALVVLSNAGRSLRLDEVASALGITSPTASDAVAALVSKGLVKRGRARDDRRAAALSLTTKGATLASRVADWPDFLLRALGALDETEQEAFLRSLLKIIRGLQESGDIPTQRMCVGCRYFHPNVHDDPARPHHCSFVNAPFGDKHLRLDCREHEPAPAAEARARWASWSRPRASLATPTGDLK